MISVTEAETCILAEAQQLPTETVGLKEAAGRILRETIHADRDVPPFHRVAMDGIAFSMEAVATGVRQFQIQGTQAAGQAQMELSVPTTGCLRVTTGAVLPAACDCIVPIEDVSIDASVATLSPHITPKRFDHIHRQGSGCSKNDILLEPGCLMDAPRISIAASTGRAELTVTRQPVITIFSNGDELVDVDQPVLPHQIRPSNNYAMAAALRRRGIPLPPFVHLPDELTAVQKGLEKGAADSDVLLLSGGVSAGEFDFVPRALEAIGITCLFHKVAQRPGKPMWFGTRPGGPVVFAFPGNPNSALICFIRFALPFLSRLLGIEPDRPEPVCLTETISFEKPLTLFRPVSIKRDPENLPQASAARYHGSGDLFVLSVSNGFVEMPAEKNAAEKGETLPFYPWP